MRLAALLLLAVALLAGQSNPLAPASSPPAPVAAPAATPAPASFLVTMTDPLVVSLAAYDLTQVANGATAWKFTVAGKSYSVSAAQQTGIAAATTIGAAAIAHRWPKLKTPLTVILAAASAYYGGKAYAQAQLHGTATAAH
jgi:hypothetical protein